MMFLIDSAPRVLNVRPTRTDEKKLGFFNALIASGSGCAMISVNETACPRLKSHPTGKELASIYRPSADELAFANTHLAGQCQVLD